MISRGRSTHGRDGRDGGDSNQATPESFVILDEVGRGTATWDGLAIAWAAVEHLLQQTKCRAIFATHYHELTSLAAELPGAANASLKAREWKQDLIFPHEVRRARRSILRRAGRASCRIAEECGQPCGADIEAAGSHHRLRKACRCSPLRPQKQSRTCRRRQNN